VAPLPELQPPPEAITLCLEDGEIRACGLPSSIPVRHRGKALVRCRHGPLFEVQELGISLDPVAGLFRVRGLGILAFQKPIRIDRL